MKLTKEKLTKKKPVKNSIIFNSKFYLEMDKEISKVFFGQKKILAETLITLFSEGHILLNGVPGLAKTLMVKALSKLFLLTYNRTQFTPDLMPADLIGFEMIEQVKNKKILNFNHGPIFCNFFLADEINRSPAKTQSALLEAMEEKQVTVAGKQYELPLPFVTLATQNPINEKGTYELPEAQLDRFMSMINITYPSHEEELQISQHSSEDNFEKITPIFKTAKKYFDIRKEIEKTKISPEVFNWIISLVRSTRPENTKDGVPNDLVNKYVEIGCSPRATKNLVKAAKTCAFFDGKKYVEKNHLEFVCPMIFRHRIKLRYEAEVDNVTTDNITIQLLQDTPL